MKYDWQISRLEERVKALEELVAHLELELKKGAIARRMRTVKANLEG